MLSLSALTQTQLIDPYIRLDKSESEIQRLKGDGRLAKANMIIVVMGPTGAGKSRFIREATQLTVPVGDSLDQEIALVDTPGFDDTNRPDAAVFRELAAWLAARYQERTRLTAIIYMYPITSTRMQGSSLRNFDVVLRMITKSRTKISGTGGFLNQRKPFQAS
jgi:predicted GTPase